MKYINMDDLTTVIQNRLLVESIEKDEEVLNGIEAVSYTHLTLPTIA